MSGRQRISKKASNDIACREAMTLRRQEWTNKIRKAKKNQLLARKRRYVRPPSDSAAEMESSPTKSPTNAAMRAAAPSSSSLAELANRVNSNPASLHLPAFQAALSSEDAKTSTFKPEDLQDALRFINSLGLIVVDQASPLRLTAARVLTNLAAIEPPNDDDGNYYGRVPDSWSDVMVGSNVFAILQQVLLSDHAEEDLVLQSCWALGNLVGDSQAARDKAIPLLPTLIQILKQGFERKQPALCRNAAWALSNLARGLATSSQLFCGPSLLTPAFLSALLTCPEKLPPSSKDGDVSWWDVAQEAAWIVAFLTAKDDATVNYLCLSQQMSFSSQASTIVIEGLACRLHQSLQKMRQAETWSSEEASQALRITIPCIRAVGNIASACEGKHLPSLLQAHSKSIPKSLATLLELGCFPSSKSHSPLGTAAVEAAWAARTILCDAGLPLHESTDIAIPILLPLLCKCVMSGYCKADLKREAISALWTASAAPPHADQIMGSIWATRTTRDSFLQQIAQSTGMMHTLVDLLRNSMDMDVVFTTLKLVSAILRRLEGGDFRLQFEESDGVNALEHICDVASSNSHYGSGTDWQEGAGGDTSVADIAADLIDDLFASPHEEEEMMDIAPASNGTTFSFGMQTTTPVAPAQPPISAGRGRGRPVPAWMSKQQGQQQGF
jgi:hypothetical protein